MWNWNEFIWSVCVNALLGATMLMDEDIRQWIYYSCLSWINSVLVFSLSVSSEIGVNEFTDISDGFLRQNNAQ